MRYIPYEFKKDDAFEFAKFVGISTFERNGELHFKKCPYCKQNTRDQKTFAINLETGQFKCLRDSCGVSGNMIRLSQDFNFSLGNDVDSYFKPKTTYRTFKKKEKPIEPKPEAVKYLESRGISETIAKRYEITVKDDKPNILCFSFDDENGNTSFIKYRKTDFDKEKDKNKEWCEPNCKPILFGMKQCNPDNKTLIITEGQIDSLSVAEAGYENAVSVPTGSKGMTWIPHCWDFVNKFETIIVFGDYEKDHISLLDDIRKRFKQRIKHIREEDYKDCKDANEILQRYGKEQIKTCIENAVDVPINHVISLADVEDINPFDIEKLPTGFTELDRLLYGGIPFGGITLITGKPGEGKSTVASQIILNAMENKHRCFAYSGELPNHLFKSWLTYQAAGAGHVFQYETRWGDKGYNISDTNKKLIDDWYRGKIDIFDSTGTETEEVGIIKLISEMIVRYGVDVVLIDNLMTALDLDSTHESDKYERQSKFVKKLASIAREYNALILLVAHKRKNNFSKNENDEISGSGDISNLAMITLTYESNEDIEPEQRLLKLSKNRLFGKTNVSGWVMDYDERSKRVYGEKDDINKEYGWNLLAKKDDGFVETEDNPFV